MKKHLVELLIFANFKFLYVMIQELNKSECVGLESKNAGFTHSLCENNTIPVCGKGGVFFSRGGSVCYLPTNIEIRPAYF